MIKKLYLLLLLVPLHSVAAPLYCTGEIKRTYVTNTGDLFIYSSWRNNYSRLCNLKGTVNNIDSITCSMWGSYVTTALKDKKKVTVRFNEDSGLTCSTIQTYNDAPAVVYVMLRDEDVG